MRWRATRLPMPRLTVPLVGACLAAVPATGVVALANGLSGIGWPGNVAVLFGQVLLLLAAISLPVYTWEDMQERIAAMPDPAPPDAPLTADERRPGAGQPDGLSLFAARLSAPLGGGSSASRCRTTISRCTIPAGSEMILCRMEDAARELGGLGRRVHRSWWVAEDAVDGVERQGQRTLLRLTDGRHVPVGRSFRPDLKAAGWL